MAKSQYVAALDEIQKPLTPLLKNLGFKRKGRTYNRLVGDGLVHVINLQMGEFPIGNYVISGIRESFYGRFTVNLGVLLPAVLELERGRGAPAFAQDYDCEIRGRLGTLAFNEDTWWDLDHRVQETAASITKLVDRAGLPFLDNFESYATVLGHLERTGELPSKNEGRSALVGALICCHLSERSRAAAFFDRAITFGNRGAHKGFLAHVTELRAKSL